MSTPPGPRAHSTCLSRAVAAHEDALRHARRAGASLKNGADCTALLEAFALQSAAHDLVRALRDVLLAQGIDPPPDRTLETAKRSV